MTMVNSGLKWLSIGSHLSCLYTTMHSLLWLNNHNTYMLHCPCYVYPSIKVGDILLYFSPLIFMSHQFYVCAFSPSLCVISVYHAGGQTRDVDPMLGYCWPTVYDAEPTSAQYWVTVSCCLTPCWMWASFTDGGPTLTQPFSKHRTVLQPAWSRPTDYGGMDTSQHRRRWPNIYQTLGRCRLALPDPQPSKHEALNQCWFYAGPLSQTVGQNWICIGSTSRVCWECWQATFVFCTSPVWRF